MPRSVQYVYRSQNLLKLNMQCHRTIQKENTKNKPPSLTFSKIPRTWSFHVVVLQRTAKKCTKNYNARAQLLFCSLNLLFCGVLVAVAVVVCLRSLIAHSPKPIYYVSLPSEKERRFGKSGNLCTQRSKLASRTCGERRRKSREQASFFQPLY